MPPKKPIAAINRSLDEIDKMNIIKLHILLVTLIFRLRSNDRSHDHQSVKGKKIAWSSRRFVLTNSLGVT